ncbi:MAG: hypothetical protein ACYCQM_10260, partial [Acidithiobacillus sp.]
QPFPIHGEAISIQASLGLSIYPFDEGDADLLMRHADQAMYAARPLLLSAIGRSTKHAGQTQLYLTPMHAAQKKVERGIENIRRGLRAVRQTAERLLGHQPWDLLVRYIVAQITQSPWLPDGAIPALAGP